MILELKRFHDDGDTTAGALFVDGIFECFVVENIIQLTYNFN